MHGQNKRRPAESGDGTMLQVHHVWRTIQGEGPFSGMPAVFVRLTGCNLGCDFCDTNWDDAGDPVINYLDLVTEIHKASLNSECAPATDLVVLTGGEPTRQPLHLLVETLGNRGYMVQIETAGTYWQPCFTHECVTLVCSPKTKNVHREILQHCDHWKYVIQQGKVNIFDGLPAGCTQLVTTEDVKKHVAPDLYNQTSSLLKVITGSAKYGDPARPPNREGVTVWLSPCDEQDAERNEQNLKTVGALAMKHGYRAQVQVHKYLNLP